MKSALYGESCNIRIRGGLGDTGSAMHVLDVVGRSAQFHDGYARPTRAGQVAGIASVCLGTKAVGNHNRDFTS
jgi:hypothetical protein